MMKQPEQTMDQETLIKLINDMLAHPEDYPMGAVYPVISALEKLEEETE